MKDIQGVERGKCSKCSDCEEYDTGQGGSVRCVCGHTPKDHEAKGATVATFISAWSEGLHPSRSYTACPRESAPLTAVANHETCSFPGCQQLVDFDLNTGTQGDWCHAHRNVPRVLLSHQTSDGDLRGMLK